MIDQLYKALEAKTKGAGTAVFEKSGMTNRYNELEFGFFPFGTGNLSGNGKDIQHCKTMILGNDFGAEGYLDGCVKNGKRESESNSTIRNLKQLNLDQSTTFYTNFHLGVRRSDSNIERSEKLQPEFTALCYDYFLEQLRIAQPEVVICLGNDVRHSLIQASEVFKPWGPKSRSLKSLYENGHFNLQVNDTALGHRRFIIIPHPCDTRNLTVQYIERINGVL